MMAFILQGNENEVIEIEVFLVKLNPETSESTHYVE